VLERIALLHTERTADDKREAVISLTTAGADLVAKAVPVWEKCQAGLVSRLCETQAKALLTVMDKYSVRHRYITVEDGALQKIFNYIWVCARL